jgi:hypothetical protein
MKKIILITFSISVLISCGGAGGGTSVPSPSISFTTTSTYPRITLGGLVNLTWSATNSESCEASGLWSGTKSVGGSEDVYINNLGDNKFIIQCTGAGGSSTASLVWQSYRMTYGKVVDGYIRQADIFIDIDNNWTLTSVSEDLAISNNEGRFNIPYTDGNLVSIGGTDLDSEVLLDNFLMIHKLSNYSDFKSITPVTSVGAFMEDSSLINEVLGIDASIDVLSFDPVANKGDGGINDYLYEKGNQLTILAYAVQNISNNLKNNSETTQDYFKAIAKIIEEEYLESGTLIDIETKAFISKVADNIVDLKSLTISDESKLNTINALSAFLPIIQVKADDNITTSLIRFGLSTFQNDIQQIAAGTASSETIINFTSNILNYIAEDQSIDVKDITAS